MKTLLAACLLFLAAPCFAQTAPHWYANVNLRSVHLEKWAADSLNQDNFGLGAEYRANRTWGFMGGFYRNSYRRTTVYALGTWTPLHLGDRWSLDAGVAAGLATGYRVDEVPTRPFMGAFLVRLNTPSHVGLNLMIVPNSGHRSSGFVGFQLAIPIK